MRKTTKTPIEKVKFAFICERTDLAFTQAAVLVRAGYEFNPANPPQTFSFGKSWIELVLGSTGTAPNATAAEKSSLSLARLEAMNRWEEAEDLEDQTYSAV
jgi:hypothetical protein